MTTAAIRVLTNDDQPALERFLAGRVADSMFLLGNSRLAGLVDDGKRYQGTYLGAWVGAELVGVLAQFWNGNIIVQAPARLDDLLAALAAQVPRPVKGILGPADQVEAIFAWLAPAADQVQLHSREYLYELPLDEMVLPPLLADEQVRARRAAPADTVLLTEWRVDFHVETLAETPTPALYRAARRGIEAWLERGAAWLLEVAGRPVAMTGFNATIAEAVQVGGVWTPPEHRSRGYARAVVAASLQAAREEGARLGVLFTDEDNLPAQRAYTALGFRYIGDFNIVLLR